MYSNKMNNLRVRVSDGGGRRGLAQGFHLQYLYHRVAIISIFDGGGVAARANGRNINFLPFMVIIYAC